MNLMDLPVDVIIYLIKFLELEDIARLSCVNQTLHGLLSQDGIWFSKCWSIISPFWQFTELPEKQQNQSYKSYFSILVDIATELAEIESEDNFKDFNQVKVGDETWKRIDNFVFKNDVWKLSNWSHDVSVGKRGDSQCYHYINNVVRYKRSNGKQDVKDPKKYLSPTMRDDLLKISHVYGFAYNEYNDEVSTEPRSILTDRDAFRKIFDNVPLFSCTPSMYPGKQVLFVFAILIYEYLETTLRELVLKKVIPFHKTSDILSELLKRSVLKTFEDMDEVFHNYDYYNEFTLSLELCEDDDEDDVDDSNFPIDFESVKKLLAHVTDIFPEVVKEQDKSLASFVFEKNDKDYLNKKIDDFQKTVEDDMKNNIIVFLKSFLSKRYVEAAENVTRPIEKILFSNPSGNYGESSKNPAEIKVYEYSLTDSDMLGGDNDHQSEAVRLLMNDDYAVIIFEHVRHC